MLPSQPELHRALVFFLMIALLLGISLSFALHAVTGLSLY